MKRSIFNVSRRKVGGIWFFRAGRFCFSFCICRKVPKTFEWEGEVTSSPPPPRPIYPGDGHVIVHAMDVCHDR